MKTKGIIITICSILIISFILGATGTITLRSAKAAENRDEYTLIGVFVTEDDLFDLMPIKINLFRTDNSLNISLPSDPIYATVSNDPGSYKMIHFEGIEGAACLYSLNKAGTAPSYFQCDPGFLINSTSIDSDNFVKLDATLYLPLIGSMEHNFMLYRVYLDKEGNAFICPLESESLLHVDKEVNGVSQAITYTQTHSRTINGKTKQNETVIKVTVLFEREADTVTILEYNAKNELIASKAYAPADVPECCKLLQDTEYVIVETRRGEELKREFIEYKDVSSIKSFYVFKNTEIGLIDASYHYFEK